MLGYRIHFNGSKFVADETATEVQIMPCDSTVVQFDKKIFADGAAEDYNANNLKNVKRIHKKSMWRKENYSS